MEPTPREGRESVLAATDAPFTVVVRQVVDDRTPDGLVCLGTFIADRLIARCVVDPEAIAMIEQHRFFEDPVRLVLTAIGAPPGIQGRLFALVEMPVVQDEEEEAPWAASVPGAGYEDAVREEESDDRADGRVAALFLGEIVRFDRDRRYRDSLARETVDILTRIVEGDVSEVVDKVLDDLLG